MTHPCKHYATRMIINKTRDTFVSLIFYSNFKKNYSADEASVVSDATADARD